MLNTYPLNLLKGKLLRNKLKIIFALTIFLNQINIYPALEIVKPVYAEAKKTSLAIIDFDNNSGNKDWDYMEKGVPRILITNLAQNKGLKIVERAKLDKAIKELNFSQTGLVNPETAKKLGKLIGADFALFGSITKFGTNRPTIVVDVTIIDVQTGEIKYVESVRGTDENNIINLLDKLSVMVINDLVPSIEPPVVKNNQQEITENNAVEIIPRISINDKLVFSAISSGKEKNIYVSNANGSFNKISMVKGNNFSPVWSPDGSKIAYVNQKTGVTIFDIKKNSTIKLSEKVVFDEDPKWSADSNKVVFMTKEEKNYAIYSSNMTSDSTNAISPPKINVKDFDISKYNMVVYTAKVGKEWQIFMIDINGNKVTQLTEEGNNTFPKWSPDGTKIIFISDRDEYQKVYMMNSNSSNQVKLTSGEYDEESPIWSFDGTKIAFISIVNKKGKVSVIDTNGTNQKVLTNDKGDYYDLKWIPNSHEIGFTSDGSIYTIKYDGSIKTMINLEIDNIEEPDWKR